MTRFIPRKSPRLTGYDYSQDGAYFLTICTQHCVSLFGKIEGDILQLNPAGEMIIEWWIQLPIKYPSIQTDVFVVMPNHFHGILVVENHSSIQQHAHSISTAMRWFKTMTTNTYIRGVRDMEWPSFEKSLWQRSFYDHIIRDEKALNAIREYVENNPVRWMEDRFYEAGK